MITPELSRHVARAIEVLPDGTLTLKQRLQLGRATRGAATLDELPGWVLDAVAAGEDILAAREAKLNEAALAAFMHECSTARYVDEAGQLWEWSVEETRYVRTPEGARRYGLPIGSPIVGKGRPKGSDRGGSGGQGGAGGSSGGPGGQGPGGGGVKALGGREKTVRTPGGGRIAFASQQKWQMKVSDRYFGSNAGGAGAHFDGDRILTVTDPKLAVAHLDRALQGRLERGEGVALKALRAKIAKLDLDGDGKPDYDDGPISPDNFPGKTETPGKTGGRTKPAKPPAPEELANQRGWKLVNYQAQPGWRALMANSNGLKNMVAVDPDGNYWTASTGGKRIEPDELDAFLNAIEDTPGMVSIARKGAILDALRRQREQAKTKKTPPAKPLVTVSAATVERKAKAIEKALAPTLARADPFMLSANSQVRSALRKAIQEQFPDASAWDRSELSRMILQSVSNDLKPPPGAGPKGRGIRVGVRALERKEAARRLDLRAVVENSRATIGRPEDFGFGAGDRSWAWESTADGGPGPTTLAKLEALRNAGAALSAEVDRRFNAQIDAAENAEIAREKLEEAREAYNKRFNQLADDIAAAWPAELGKPSPMMLLIFPERREDNAAKDAFLDQWRDQARKLNKEHKALRQAQKRVEAAEDGNVGERTRDQIVREVLGEIRPMGRDRDTRLKYQFGEGMTGADAERIERMLGEAEASYPTDWIARNREKQPQGIRVTRAAKRPYYQAAFHKIEAGIYSDDINQQGAVTHEMGHSFEVTVPHVKRAQWAFLKDRITRSGKPGERQFDELSDIYPPGEFGPERGYRDDFRSHYTGKEYFDSSDAPFELLTTGMEDLMTRQSKKYNDADMEHFLLGMLALL